MITGACANLTTSTIKVQELGQLLSVVHVERSNALIQVLSEIYIVIVKGKMASYFAKTALSLSYYRVKAQTLEKLDLLLRS